MQIIPESRMSFQSWFKGKRYLSKYTQQQENGEKGFTTNQPMAESKCLAIVYLE